MERLIYDLSVSVYLSDILKPYQRIFVFGSLPLIDRRLFLRFLLRLFGFRESIASRSAFLDFRDAFVSF